MKLTNAIVKGISPVRVIPGREGKENRVMNVILEFSDETGTDQIVVSVFNDKINHFGLVIECGIDAIVKAHVSKGSNGNVFCSLNLVHAQIVSKPLTPVYREWQP